MTIARDLGFEVEVGNILRSDLYTADEAFLTGTAAEVVPIRSVDDRVVGDGRPGPITRRIQEVYPRGRPRPGRPVQGLGRACRVTTLHVHRTRAVVPASCPTRSTSTTPPCATAASRKGLSLTVDDKLRVAEQLDHLGVQYIEGGWPGANPKDEEFFRRAAAGELHLQTATLVAFGSTRKAGGRAETDPVLADLLAARTAVVCLVAKSAEWHVTETLRTTLTEAVDMVADSVGYLVQQGRRVFLDAEHFFDGYRTNPGFSPDVLRAAASAGAEVLVLCDTNGGSLPFEVERVVGEVRDLVDIQLGCHFHNDSGCAVANSLHGRPHGCHPGPGLRQRLRRAHRQRRSDAPPSRICRSRWGCAPSPPTAWPA